MAHVVSINLTQGLMMMVVELVMLKKRKHEIGEEMGQGVSWISWGEVGSNGYDQNIFYNVLNS